MATTQVAPDQTRQWTIEGTSGFSDLHLSTVALPQLGSRSVRIKIHAVSLNARDVQIITGLYRRGYTAGTVAGSDGAGSVVAVGTEVSHFKAGDRVMPIFHQGWFGGPLVSTSQLSKLGAHEHGVLREYADWNEESLVTIPASLTYEEAATLPCAGVTAWNSLFGGARSLRLGDTVLTQGSGGVSLFAIQFARAAGAQVIATTGSMFKADKLKHLGAHHVISYKDEKWGEIAKNLSTDGRGVDFIVEVSGSPEQSLKAISISGEIEIIGGLTAADSNNSFDMYKTDARLRKIAAGSKMDFEEMNRAIEFHKLKPIVDSKVFKFEQTREAYEYMASPNHHGKVGIRLS